MLPKPTLITPIPELTIRVAQAAFPRGNTFMLMRDALKQVYDKLVYDFFDSNAKTQRRER